MFKAVRLVTGTEIEVIRSYNGKNMESSGI